jgi:hypothetical protein
LILPLKDYLVSLEISDPEGGGEGSALVRFIGETSTCCIPIASLDILVSALLPPTKRKWANIQSTFRVWRGLAGERGEDVVGSLIAGSIARDRLENWEYSGLSTVFLPLRVLIPDFLMGNRPIDVEDSKVKHLGTTAHGSVNLGTFDDPH